MGLVSGREIVTTGFPEKYWNEKLQPSVKYRARCWSRRKRSETVSSGVEACLVATFAAP